MAVCFQQSRRKINEVKLRGVAPLVPQGGNAGCTAFTSNQVRKNKENIWFSTGSSGNANVHTHNSGNANVHTHGA
jgi:hypothetical protein